MNHRELILSAQKKPKFGFLALPEDLQDEIVDGLDSGTLTMREASEMVKARGKSLSHEAIAAYYGAVRRERRLYESRRNLSQMISRFAGLPPEESAREFSDGSWHRPQPAWPRGRSGSGTST